MLTIAYALPTLLLINWLSDGFGMQPMLNYINGRGAFVGLGRAMDVLSMIISLVVDTIILLCDHSSKLSFWILKVNVTCKCTYVPYILEHFYWSFLSSALKKRSGSDLPRYIATYVLVLANIAENYPYVVCILCFDIVF